MENFTVYLKDGERWELSLRRFVVNEVTNEVELYDDGERMFGVLMLQQVAAVVPSQLHRTERQDMRTFTVYLRKHVASPFMINANNYVKDPGFAFIVDNRPLRWAYVDPREVAAITYRPTNE